MDTYNYSPNGIDYDPDLLYGGPADPAAQRTQRQGREASRPDNRRAPRDDSRRQAERYDTPRRDEAPRQRRRPANYDGVANREALADRDRQRRNREYERREEAARQRERAEKMRRDEIAADKAAQKRIRDAERAAEKARKAAEREAARADRKPFTETGFVKFFLDKRTHAFFGVVLICVAVYLLVAAISFMRTGPADQSVVSSLSVSQITSTGTKVDNSGGPVGAMVAQMVFAQGLGLGSLTAIIYLVLLGLGLMGIKKCNFWSVTFKSLLVAVAISVVAGFFALWAKTDFLFGGVHGQWLNSLLVENVDWIGAALVSVILIAAVIYLYLNDFITLYNRYKALQKARKEKAEQIRLEREEAQAKVIAAMREDEDFRQRDDSSSDGSADSLENHEERRDAVAAGFGDELDDTNDEYAIGEVAPIQPMAGEYHEATDSDLKVTTEAAEATLAEEGRIPEPPSSPHTDAEAPAMHVAPVTIMPQQEEYRYISEHNGQDGEEKTAEDAEHHMPAVSASPVIAAEELPAEETTDQGPTFDVVANTIESADPAHVGADTMYDPTAELSRYKRPGIDLLNQVEQSGESYDLLEQEANKERIIRALGQFDIQISKIEATVGPTVTLYEIVPAEGTRIAKIKRLEDDIAMTLSAKGIRIIAPIPGKGTIGIEVPNHDAQTVSIHSILSSKAFQETDYELPMAMGATISNDVYIADLAAMPHILVAGATGQGKSVGLNTIIASLLYKKHPAELKFVLIDPKRVEFSLYNALERHFLAKLPDEEEAIVTNMDNVVKTLNSLCVEMERRYDLLKDAHVVKITKYNELFIQKKLNPEKGHRYLPYIVIIVDEFADLIMVAGKQVETPIARIAQMARAVGMHMIIATQRPSTNVITGLIKANFPGRVAFRVSQMVDSKTILDRPGANQLIGRGDMLFSHNGSIDRVQCAYIDTKEVHRICDFIDNQAGYEHAYFLPEPMMDDNDGPVGGGSGNLADRDPLFEEAAQIIVQTGVASTSSLQRRYSIGYNRAGKIMDQLEAAGIVGPATGGKARSVLIDAMQLGSVIKLNDD